MMMKRQRSAWAWFVLKAGTGILLAAAALDGSGQLASADPTGAPPSEPPPEPGPVIEPIAESDVHVPGTSYADGPGEIPFDELSPADQQGVTRMGEWAETQSGPDVSAAWSSSVTSPSVNAAKVRQAEYASGTNGLSEVGVE